MSAAVPTSARPRDTVLDPDGVDWPGLVARFGSPLYVYDFDVVEARIGALRAALPALFEVAYAMKSNPSLGLVGHVGAIGVGLDVASGGELAAARAAGVEGSRIIFTGPGKRDDELEAVVRAGARAVTVESLGELRRLGAIASRHGRVQPVLLRARAGDAATSEPVRILGDGAAGKFGMGDDELSAAAVEGARSASLDVLGIHAFGASNVLEIDAIVDHVATTVRRARALAALTGFALRLVDVGGGLGIPYADDETPLDLPSLGRRLQALAAEWSRDPGLDALSILIEPGRYLVGPAGVYVTKVLDVKAGEFGRIVAIVDGGIHHLVRPALTGREHRVRLVTASRHVGDWAPAPVTVAGPLCSGLDILARSATIAVPRPGDLVLVLDAGAYGFTESMPLFLSHPTPAEVALRGGEVRRLRPRIEPSTWLTGQEIPDWTHGSRSAGTSATVVG
jgi:diaminopimelate decarboxylase